MPNPFDRPRAMLILEVTGVEGMLLKHYLEAAACSSLCDELVTECCYVHRLSTCCRLGQISIW